MSEPRPGRDVVRATLTRMVRQERILPPQRGRAQPPIGGSERRGNDIERNIVRGGLPRDHAEQIVLARTQTGRGSWWGRPKKTLRTAFIRSLVYPGGMKSSQALSMIETASAKNCS